MRKNHNSGAGRNIKELLEGEKTEGLFEYLELYKNSRWEKGKPCVECESETDEAQLYELEQARLRSSGEDTVRLLLAD